jgi:hypothetical protein
MCGKAASLLIFPRRASIASLLMFNPSHIYSYVWMLYGMR